MSSSHNQARNSATDQIQDPAVKAAVEAAIKAEEEAEDEDSVEDADSYTEFVLKSEKARDESVAKWKIRAAASYKKRLALIISAREQRHQKRVAQWALDHDSAITLDNVALLEDVIAKQEAAAQKQVEAARAQLAKIRAMRGEAASEETIEATSQEETAA